MLQALGVSFGYGDPSQPLAVHDVTLDIAPGSLVGLLGHNGSGKSTLARLLAGVHHARVGRVIADGFDAADRAGRWEVRQRVGIVFQNPDDQLVANTLLDEIAFGPENLGLPRDEIERRVAESVALLDLGRYAETPLNELSLGLKQRVAIAGVLAMRPRYLILDEPTSMLPPQLAAHLLATVTALAHQQGVGVIHITHRMDEVATFDRLVVMDAGAVVLDGAPGAVFGQGARLRALGLDVPLAADLAGRLRARGYAIPTDVLTDAALARAVKPYVVDGATPPLTPPRRGEEDFAATVEAEGEGASAQNPSPEGRSSSAMVLLPAPGRSQRWGPSPSTDPLPSEKDGREIPILATREAAFTHLAGTPFAQVGLAGLTCEVRRGEVVAFVGASRSGKSTLVDCLNGIIRPGRGMVFYRGTDVSAAGFDMDALRAAVGVVYQSPESQIFSDVVGKDVAFGPQRRGVSLAESRRLVRESLEAVGLPYEDFRSRYTYALSGGERRRVAIAGVLAMEPEVLVLDEPTAGLDPRGRADFLALVRRLHAERGLTVVYLAAGLEDVADLADRVYVLDGGRVAFAGTPTEVAHRLPELNALGVGLPATSRLALALRAAVPELTTDARDADALEAALLPHLAPPGASGASGHVASATGERSGGGAG